MRVETMEKRLHQAGALGALIAAIALYSGIWRGRHHAKGRVTGPAPTVARILVEGNQAVYAGAGVGATAVLYLLWHPLRASLPASVRVAATIAGALLYFPGLTIMVWGRVAMGDMHNVSSSLAVQLYADHRLVTSGPFAVVRHPMYVGGIMAELGALLLYRTWAVLLISCNAPMLLMRAGREEQALAAEFGKQWVDYTTRVPGWIPRLGKAS